jgi:hypothetical protein
MPGCRITNRWLHGTGGTGQGDLFYLFAADPGFMNMHRFIFFCMVLLSGLVFCAACTSSDTQGGTGIPTEQVTRIGTPVTSVSPSGPGPSLTPASAAVTDQSTPVPQETTVKVTTPWIQKAYGKNALDDPRIVLEKLTKKSMAFDIPDCGMRQVFPEAAADPAYGIRQPSPRLVMLTEDRITAFFQAYAKNTAGDPNLEPYIDPNTIGGAQCNGVPGNPKWNFVRINATLIPRNARPSEYGIGINLKSGDTVVDQLALNATLVLEQPVFVVRYIPLKTEEMDAFDSMEMVFLRKG